MQYAENPRRRRRKSRRHRSRRKGSWRGFIRKHRSIMKRLGLKRGIKKIAAMWRRK